jgi:DNA-binding transcriptional ArsR family regulator
MIRNNKTKNVSGPAGKPDVDKAMLFEMQADICQALANPKRLQVLDLLKGGELSVGEMMKAMGIPKANLSQHLAVMRQKGIVSARREGTTVYYRLARPRITEACAVMREVLMDGFRDQERLARRVREGLSRKKP